MPNAQGICGVNELEKKRILRVAAANLRVERKLAQRRAQALHSPRTLASTAQETLVPQLEGCEIAAKQEHAVVPEADIASSESQLPAAQSVQSGLLP